MPLQALLYQKNGMKLEVSKIRGETSYGMLCSESELKLSEESEGIIALSQKFTKHIGKSYFKTKNNNNVIELSNEDLRKAVDSFEIILNKTFDYRGSLSYINKSLGETRK